MKRTKKPRKKYMLGGRVTSAIRTPFGIPAGASLLVKRIVSHRGQRVRDGFGTVEIVGAGDRLLVEHAGKEYWISPEILEEGEGSS